MTTTPSGSADRPVLFLLHYLGGSAEEWDAVASLLESQARCIAIDLPGFGDAPIGTGTSVADMAGLVAAKITAEAPRRWAIAGHSMGAKIAAAIVRRAEDGDPSLAGLQAACFLAGSPPGPEPMEESQRQTMLGWLLGDAASTESEAHAYIAANTGRTLAPETHTIAASDLVRTDRTAWQAWLENGSREDWSDRIGVLNTPTLLIAGGQDKSLGPDAQRRLALPHLAAGRLETIQDSGHLLPLEAAGEVAALLGAHLKTHGMTAASMPGVDDAYRALIASSHVSRRTRQILEARGQPGDPSYRPAAMGASQFATLGALLGRVLPQQGPFTIELAARIDATLAEAAPRGWRFAALPADAEACRQGLDTLDAICRARHGATFVALSPSMQDEILEAIAASRADPGHKLDAAALALWFEDLRALAVQAAMSHPATLARLGYSGIAYGGDGEPKTGFRLTGAGEREGWEPKPHPVPAP